MFWRQREALKFPSPVILGMGRWERGCLVPHLPFCLPTCLPNITIPSLVPFIFYWERAGEVLCVLSSCVCDNPLSPSIVAPRCSEAIPSFFLLPFPTPPTMVSPGAQWRRGGGGGREEAGGGGAGACIGGGRSALPLPLVPGAAVDAAASPAPGTPARTRVSPYPGRTGQVRPVSQSLTSTSPGAEASLLCLAAILSSDALLGGGGWGGEGG